MNFLYWIARIYTEDGHVVAEKIYDNMLRGEASEKAQEWSRSLGYEDYVLLDNV